MRAVGLIVAALVSLIGLTGIAAPNWLMTISPYSLTPLGIFLAAALRIVIGLVLVAVAPKSRAPAFLRIVGIIALIAGVITLFLRIEQAQAVVAWSQAHGLSFIRLWATIPFALGAFIFYAILRGPQIYHLADC